MMLPIEPNKEDCCGSGCQPCIFDVYEKHLQLYEKHLKNSNEQEYTATNYENAINQLKYTEFVLIQAKILCNDHMLLCFKQKNYDNKLVMWNPGDHFLVKFISNTCTCSRAYTPVKPEIYWKDMAVYDFAIIVKRYTNGLVSNFLFNLKPGQITLWRGPYGLYDLKLNAYSRIVMIAQGTGILPFLSIINKILDNEDDITSIFLYYSCETSDKILFRDNLFDYKTFWNFNYKIFVRCILQHTTLKYLEPLTNCKLSLKDIKDIGPYSKNDQILICGSKQFMNQYQEILLTLGALHENIILF